MISTSLVMLAYLAAAVCFIFSLGGLSRHETSRRGNAVGIIGMTIAIAATLASGNVATGPISWTALMGLLITGAIAGTWVASRVQMTAMPQLVAILHSFVGLAAVLVGIANHIDMVAGETAETMDVVHRVEILLGVVIGAVTFTGSIVAWGKLQGVIASKPLLLPARHLLNLTAVILIVVLGFFFFRTTGYWSLVPLVAAAVIALALGVHLVMAIGGADMPVVVSMLNSYSGWAAAATGFMLGNDLLIVTGALVGSSGAILSYIMCRAMNRSFISVILGGFGVEAGTTVAAADANLTYTETTAEETARHLADAERVIVIPGYGMAVAQAQHPVREIAERLRNHNVQVRFAIHPVAGRLPGHMNVLLAEAKVPYDIVFEMDEINGDFCETDVVLVIGANDIVNPAAQDDPTSPIYGMPVLEAWKAREVVVLKRSMATGYSGIDNPLFYKPNTRMLFGDAKKSVDSVLGHLS